MKVFNRIIAICLCVCFVGVCILAFSGCDDFETVSTSSQKRETNQNDKRDKDSFLSLLFLNGMNNPFATTFNTNKINTPAE